MAFNHAFLLVGISYVLIMTAPTVKFPNLIEWFGEVVAVPERSDRSALNPHHFYRGGHAAASGHELFEHYQRAAESGEAQAQYKLGLAYEHGLGVIQNEQQALLWYEASAQQQFREAQLRLGYAHYDGSLGLSANVLRAQDWFGAAGLPDLHPTRLSQMH